LRSPEAWLVRGTASRAAGSALGVLGGARELGSQGGELSIETVELALDSGEAVELLLDAPAGIVGGALHAEAEGRVERSVGELHGWSPVMAGGGYAGRGVTAQGLDLQERCRTTCWHPADTFRAPIPALDGREPRRSRSIGGLPHDPSAIAAPTRLVTWPFLRLCLVQFAIFVAAFQLFPTIPFHLLDLGVDRAGAGLFLTVYTWASALSAPFTGTLADRFGRRRVLLVACAAFIAFSLLYGAVRAVPVLLGVACLHGFFWSGMLSASGALVVDVIPPARRTQGIALYGIAPTAAIAVAPALGLWMYRFGWRALTTELAAIGLVVLALALQVRPTAAHDPASARVPLREAVSWRVIASASGLFLIALGYGGVTSYAALLAVERHIAPRSLFFTAFALTVIATRALLPGIADRSGATRLMLPAFLLVPPGLALVAIAHSPWQLAGAAIVFATGFGSAYPAYMTWVLGRTDARHRAATYGSVLLAFDTAIGTGSLLVGHVAQTASLRVGFLTLAALSALAVPAFLLCRPLLPALAADAVDQK
jgi:MFS family permease